MSRDFYQHIFNVQQKTEAVPANEKIASWVSQLICLMYPERAACFSSSPEEIGKKFEQLKKELVDLLNATKACAEDDNAEKAAYFLKSLPELYRVLNTDIEAILQGDPAAHTRFEVIRAYPGFVAIAFYRIAHTLLDLNTALLPRIITEWAHSVTGIDIHPAAEIGEYFCIDHGTGIVIGETSEIGNYVKIYQGVTLGALSVDKSLANTKRHPTVQDHVIIYSGATILGGETVIGHHSIIGGNVWLTKSIPPYSTVYHRPDIEVVEKINS
jgi:serine O-acetyltransferase